jgi:Flp pilus assembly protein TadG
LGIAAELRTMKAQERRRRMRGQAMVEFALVLPVFLFVVMMTIDFGWALRAYITTTNSAREGARLGVTGASVTSIQNKVASSSAGLLEPSDATVTGAQGDPGSNVTVTVTYDYTYLTPLGSLLSPLQMSSTAVMRIE